MWRYTPLKLLSGGRAGGAGGRVKYNRDGGGGGGGLEPLRPHVLYAYDSPKLVTLTTGPYLSSSWWMYCSSPALDKLRIISNSDPTIGRPLGPIRSRNVNIV